MFINKLFKWSAYRRQQGTSLVEMMIAVSLGIILIGGLLRIASNLYAYSYKMNQYSQLLFELQSAMDMMVRDIRRAGYWGNEQSRVLTNTASNPFNVSGAPGTDIYIQSIGTGTNNCILLSYDYDKNGSVSNSVTVNSNEHFGYKLSNNALYTLTTDQSYSCLSTAYWESLTTPNTVSITNLNFSLTNYTVSGTTKTMTMRYMTITLTGQLTSDATLQATLQQNVLIRNRKIV